MEKAANDFLPTRESLLRRLKDWEDQESWQDFFNIYRRLIFSTALKAGLTEQEAEDVVQETIISVAKTIKGFEYDPDRCTFKSWLRHLTGKRIADRFRKRSRAGRKIQADETLSDTSPIERVPDPNSLDLDAVWEEEWQKKLLDTAIEKVKSQVGAEQYQIFDFYVIKKMPVKKVVASLGTSVGQVYLAKHRVSKLIKKEIKHLEEKMS